MWQLLSIGNLPFRREWLCLFGQKSLNEGEREARSHWDESYYAWRNSSLQVLPSWLEYLREKGFDTDILNGVTHFQVLSLMFLKYGQI